MVIEFRKVPQSSKNFEDCLGSVKIEGSFCKISPSLVEISSKIHGDLEVECSRCGKSFVTTLEEDIEFLVSDGVYKDENSERCLDTVIIEVDNHIIDFENIVQSELESFKLDYHVCDNCLNNEE